MDERPESADLTPPEDGGGDDWSFDAADVAPETGDLESLSPEDLAELERRRADEAERDEQARREIEQQMDEEGRQRRQNVRVMVKYPITVHVEGLPTTAARTRDLSATGVGFATRLPLELESSGTVTVHFDDWDFHKEFVVRFVKPILAGKQIGAQFQELTDDERERVVREVFAVQREQLQKERATRKQ